MAVKRVKLLLDKNVPLYQDWHKSLPQWQLTLNCKTHPDVKMTPYYAVFGREALTTPLLEGPSIPPSIPRGSLFLRSFHSRTHSNDSSEKGGNHGNTCDCSVECGHNSTSSESKEATVGDCELSCTTLSVRDSPPSSEMVGPSGVRSGTNSMSSDALSHSSIYKADLNSRLPSTAVSPLPDGLDPIPTPNDGSSPTHPGATVTDAAMASSPEKLVGTSQGVVTEEKSSPQEPLATSIYSSPSHTSVLPPYGSTDVLSRRPEEQLLADYPVNTYGSNNSSKSIALPLKPTEPPQESTNPIPMDSAGRIASRTTMWRPGSNGTDSVPAPRTAGDTNGSNHGLVVGTPPAIRAVMRAVSQRTSCSSAARNPS